MKSTFNIFEMTELDNNGNRFGKPRFGVFDSNGKFVKSFDSFELAQAYVEIANKSTPESTGDSIEECLNELMNKKNNSNKQNP